MRNKGGHDFQQRALDGVFWSYVQNWLARSLSLLVVVFLARVLTPKDFGVFAIVSVLIGLSEVLVEQALAHAIVQRRNLEEAHINAAFWMTLFSGLLLTIVAIVLAQPLATVFGHAEIGRIVLWLSPVCLLMAVSSVPAALLRRELKYKVLAKRVAAANLVSGVLAVIMALSGYGVWSFVGQQITFQVVGALILWRYEPLRIVPTVSLFHLKQLFGFSSLITLVRLLEFIETKVIDLVVGGMLAVVALGNFSIATRASQALTQLVAAPLWDAAIGTFARIQGDMEQVRTSYFNIIQFSGMVEITIFLLVASAGPHLIPGVFGAQWAPSAVSFQVLCLVGAIRTVSTLNACLIQALGYAATSAWLSAIRVASIFGAIPWLLEFGIEGVSFALLIGHVLVLPMSSLILRNRTGIPPLMVAKHLLMPLLLTLGGCLVTGLACDALSAKMGDLGAAVAGLVFGGASYLLLVILFAPDALRSQLSLLSKLSGRAT